VHASPRDPSRYLPEKKVAAAGAAGFAVTVLVYVAGLLGHDLPTNVAVAGVGLVMFAAAWLAPHTRRDDVEEG
jgi:hypothetical protein